jgi:NTE family protein
MRKKVGLALSGGGARGFSHIGVVRVLVENDIPIDLIAGTSAGSFVGGALACGMSGDEILAVGNRIGWLNVLRPSFSSKGLFSNAPIGKFVRDNFPFSRIEELKVPYAAVAYDLLKREPVILRDSGDLPTAIRASCAVPGIFTPVVDEEKRMLVDGGVVAPMPTDLVRAMGADVVIGVDLLACGASFHSRPRTSVGILFQSTMTLLRTASDSQATRPDVAIEPKIAHLRPDQIAKRDEFVRLGEEAAANMLDRIRAIIA